MPPTTLNSEEPLMQAEINTLTSTRVPRGLTELITLGRTLKRRAGDILAYFEHPHTSNGPTEAINGRLEHLRGSALGLAKPHQLHHPSTPRNRRIQTPTTPSIMKSRKTCLRWSRPQRSRCCNSRRRSRSQSSRALRKYPNRASQSGALTSPTWVETPSMMC